MTGRKTPSYLLWSPPWYNRDGWLGVRHQVTCYYRCADWLKVAVLFRLCGGSGFHSGAGCGFQRTSVRHLSHQVFMQPPSLPHPIFALSVAGPLLFRHEVWHLSHQVFMQPPSWPHLCFAPAMAGPLLVMIILTCNDALYSVRVTRSRRCTLYSSKRIRVSLCAVIVFVLFMCVVAEISKKTNTRQHFSKKR